MPLQYKAKNIGKYYADFIVEDEILLELKVVPRMGYVHVRKLLQYLITAQKKVGILLYFTREGVKYRRVINPKI